MAKILTKKWRKFLKENAGKTISMRKLKANLRYPYKHVPEGYINLVIYRIKESHNITTLR